MSLPERIRALREALELSQDQLAERAGLSRTQVSNLERGVHEPGSQTIRRLAAALGVQPGDLLNQPAEPAEGAA